MRTRPLPTPRSWLRGLAAALLAVVAAYVAAIRLGAPPAPVNVLLWVPGALLVVLIAVLALAFAAAVRGPRRVAAAAEGVLAAGLAGVLLGGVANWALQFQGAAVLMERTSVKLSSWDELAAVAAGPLYDRRTADVTIALGRLRLEPVGPDEFRAVSRLRVLSPGGEEQGIDVVTSRGARAGNLIFHQGAFGFAPRIVIARAGATLLDEHVPFKTVRNDAAGLAFVGDFEVAAEGLAVHGAVTLDDLNDEMKGHPRLELAVERDGEPLGSGTLRPGEFVDLGGGLRIGFAGLSRWAEILFSRPRFGRWVVASTVVAALGALGWAVAVWRRW